MENQEVRTTPNDGHETTGSARRVSFADAVLSVVKPHNDRIIAEHRVAEACKALDLIVGELGACIVQRAASDDTIIAEHIQSAHDIALTALRRLRT